jgi:outer membrane protein OmpA-like peptidoglycan-associated protein
VSLPLAVAQDGSDTGGLVNGERIVSTNEGGVGDLRFGADLRLAGNYGDAFTLALGGRLWLPTGDPEKFLGDDDLRVGPHLAIAGDAGALAYAARAGVVYRGKDEPFAGHTTGTEATFAVAMGIRAVDKKLLIGPELYGTSVISDSDAFFREHTTPLGLLGSLHYTAGDVRLGAGAGPGLSHAAGTPVFRALVSLEYAPGIDESRPAPYAAPPAPLPADRDGDGVLDTEDACPDVAGVRTADPQTNGCPADRDKDSIVDTDDACPDVAGVRTDDPKTNGCPADRDQDSIADVDDACPDVAGVKTKDPKTNGCPPDGDKDGILDPQDACPYVPGPANADPKKNGCPLAFVKENQIQITEQIKFRFGKADLDPVSDPVLEAVLKVLQANTSIARLRIEGHTDNKGSAELNKRLSNARAAAVVNWLVKHGVDRKQLTSTGFGFDKPLDTNETEEGRANNRRVEFHIEGEGKPKP